MYDNFSYYSTVVELCNGINIKIFSRARFNVLALQYSKNWLNENEKVWKIRDTILLDEKKEKYLLKRVQNCILELPEEGIWRVEAEDRTLYKKRFIPFCENMKAQESLTETLMCFADS